MPIRARGTVEKVACGDEEAERWYVADPSVDGEAWPGEAGSPAALDAEVAERIDLLRAIDPDLAIERGIGGADGIH